MPLINVIIILAVIGVCLYLIETYIPMDAAIKTIIRVVIIIVLCLWLLQVFGITTGNMNLTRVR